MPILHIKTKQIGRRKAMLLPRPYDTGPLPEHPTLRDLLTAIVRQEVATYNSKEPEQPLLPFLSPEALDDAAATGKISFGTRYNYTQEDAEKAVERAVLAFEDALYAVFLDGEELRLLDTVIKLQAESELVFIRLALLRG